MWGGNPHPTAGDFSAGARRRTHWEHHQIQKIGSDDLMLVGRLLDHCADGVRNCSFRVVGEDLCPKMLLPCW